mmetsp:Transcript_15266/g.22979  ORF Transcript_15266/g.22979 Transcript_15266/m.22979 type:complete len:504 (+) Transcript_15266:53-1564(+)|eukprot:CAMPEP_0185025044 /NCGR_PEP_ID=MMETSP1103-20130426/8154_1 /TAXON_ID=36769 /ORGANISM="Paraphysomonas bandaiensis, Strain Caron Lab Isolate" /LENGTH=503 /DNA_ID=CAMNT_0027558155 /DNA_START=53 /DNA_END=1564 /DNA_ORIENTATION=+
MSYKNKLYINGEWRDAIKGGTFDTINPATEEIITSVAAATSEDIDVAVEAAVRCLHSSDWGYCSTGAQRAQILRKLGDLFTAHQDELARLDSLDQGKPLREAKADLGDAISCCAHFAKLAEEQDSKQNEVIDNGTDGEFVTTIVLEPIGVVAAITPWNYPLLMAVWKVVPAIAAGCTIVLKPSELAPLSCLVFGELCTQAGLPNGALNVVPGLGPDAGGPLSSHPAVDKVSFTGSVPTARRVMTCAAAGPRAVTLELGGKSPLIIFEDAELDSAVDWVITGFLWGSGQVCSATARVLVHSSLRETFMKKLIDRIAFVKLGDSLTEEMISHEGGQMGPLVNKTQYDKVWAFIDGARAEGCVFAYGGERAMVSSVNNGKGYFIPPTVIVDPPTTATVWNEEIFGPVLCVREFSTEDEAVQVANDTPYGLAGAVFSADSTRCERVSRRLRVGIVWRNNCQPAFIQAPWGGCKMSGFGRDLGRWGLEEFTNVKQVTTCAPGHQWSLW